VIPAPEVVIELTVGAGGGPLTVMKMPVAPSPAAAKAEPPRLKVWKSRLATWLALFDTCSTPVDRL
jgi:hypothetical protein